MIRKLFEAAVKVMAVSLVARKAIASYASTVTSWVPSSRAIPPASAATTKDPALTELSTVTTPVRSATDTPATFLGTIPQEISSVEVPWTCCPSWSSVTAW